MHIGAIENKLFTIYSRTIHKLSILHAPSIMNTPSRPLADLVSDVLRKGPESGASVCKLTGISQASFSRTIHEMQRTLGGIVLVLPRVGGARAPQYALARKIPRCEAVIPVHMVDETGRVTEVGFVAMLIPRGSATLRDGTGRVYDGLPPEVNHAAPAGFIGRNLAKACHQDLGLPPSLKDWSDDHRIVFLCNRSSDVPGNLVFGNESLTQLLTRRAQPALPATARATDFARMAMESAAVSAGTSSAGGEQPKFSVEMEDTGHVLVKYTRSGTRMADLLHMEHLALNALKDNGVAAATTQRYEFNGVTFLEIERFDRKGRAGRLGMISAGAFDDEHFGSRDNWADFARRLVKAEVLDETAVMPILVQQAFSQLTGNTDTHFENLSLMLDADGEVSSVAPAYDILPMCYAPGSASGMDPELKVIQPSVGRIGANPAVWEIAARAALAFWDAASTDTAISKPMRDVAKLNRAQVAAFVEPLLPPPATEAPESPAPSRRRARP